MRRSWLSSLSLALMLSTLSTAGVPAAANAPAPVYCASVTCFQIRVTAMGRDPETRAAAAIDVINKYLGGSVGKVATKPDGKNVRLLLNNELVAVVTPADAAAEKQKSAAALAARWASALSKAFEASKAQR